jgi:phosphoribosylamine---glycine ligase
MNILLIGSGGREHAMAHALKKSPSCNKLCIAPGNGGTAALGKNIPLDILDFSAIKTVLIEEKIDLLILGPEAPIVKGIYDYFRDDSAMQNLKVLAPEARASMLEGSKDFAKKFMEEFHIPTASYRSFVANEYEQARTCIENHSLPVVIKADGLAAGKGVSVCYSKEGALHALDACFLHKKFKKAGNKILVESFLDGIEVSFFVITDGDKYLILPEAKDYKQIAEGNKGPNTGGMGSVSPVIFADHHFKHKVQERIIRPTIHGLKSRGLKYKGFIFFGLMNVKGDPFVIEYNVKLGDPEAEAIIPRIQSDFAEMCYLAADEKLRKHHLELNDCSSVALILASEGYPDTFEKNKVITGTENTGDNLVFHAGTYLHEGQLFSSGGRVLCINSLKKDMQEAIGAAYSTAEKICFDNKYYRKDIGQDLLALKKP